MGETADRPDAGGEGSGGAEDPSRPAGQPAEALPVVLPVAVAHLDPFHPQGVRLPGEGDPVLLLRLVLGDADQVLQAGDDRAGEEQPGGAAGEVAHHFRGRGVDVLDDAGGVAVGALLVAVGEADLLVEHPLRVRGEGEEAGDHRVAVAHEEAAHAGAVEAGAQQDRRGADRPGGEDDERRRPGFLPALRRAFLPHHALHGGDPAPPGAQAAHRGAGNDRQETPGGGGAEEAGGVVLRLHPAGEAVAGVAADALRRPVAREVDRQRQRERPESQAAAGVLDALRRGGERGARIRIRPRTRRLDRVGAGGSVDAQEPFRFGVPGLEVLVEDRPAVEVGGAEAERGRPVEDGLPAHDLVHRQLLGRRRQLLPGAGLLADAERTSPVAGLDEDPPRVPVVRVPVRPAAPLQQEDAGARAGQRVRGEGAPESGTDDQGVVAAGPARSCRRRGGRGCRGAIHPAPTAAFAGRAYPGRCGNGRRRAVAGIVTRPRYPARPEVASAKQKTATRAMRASAP